MSTEVLYNFFKGVATFDEEKQVKEWVEFSEVNFDSFMKMRKEFDALCMSGINPCIKRKRPLLTFSLLIASISATVAATAATAFVLITGGFQVFSDNQEPEKNNLEFVASGSKNRSTL